MTTINMNAIDAITNELAAGNKLSKALLAVYTKRNVAIPYNAKWFELEIDALELSTRTNNALRRAHLNTINDVMQYIEEGKKIGGIRNLGVTSCQEFMEAILDYAWDCMDVQERAEFLIDTVDRNASYIRG